MKRLNTANLILNIILIGCLLVLLVLSIRICILQGLSVESFSKINDLVFIIGLLIFVNRSHIIGMIISECTLILYFILLYFFSLSSLNTSSIFRVIACVYLLYHVILKDRAIKRL
jgi:hypothetical protein